MELASMMGSVAKQFGESKGWTWTLFVLSSCGIGLALTVHEKAETLREAMNRAA